MTTLAPPYATASEPPAGSQACPWFTALRGLRITFSGLLYVATVVLVGLAALSIEANLLFLVFGINLGVVLFSLWAPIRSVRSVVVERTAPEAVVAGRLFTIVYVLRSRRRWWRCWGLMIGEGRVDGAGARLPEAWIPALHAGEESRVELSGRCIQRGRIRLHEVLIRSSFPFGLFLCAVKASSPTEITVHPAVGRVRKDPWKDRRFAASASARHRQEQGGHDEFFGVREYREGDNLRWIHWRRSAHAGQLVVREMMPMRPTQLIVLVDPWPPAEPGRSSPAPPAPDSAVERVISAAATVVCDGLERNFRVGLVCRARVPVVVAPAGGRAHRHRMLHELAVIEPGADVSFDELVSHVRWTGGWQSQCLVLTTAFGPSHERVVRFLNRQAEAVLPLTPFSAAFDAIMDLSRVGALEAPKP